MKISETLKPHQKAPGEISSAQLMDKLPVSAEALLNIATYRTQIAQSYATPGASFIVAVGECGVVAGIQEKRTRHEEGKRIMKLSELAGGLVLQRINVWKPRSNADDWHGLETTDPVAAYESVVDAVNNGVPVAMEIFYEEQLERYGHLISAMWIGSRTTDNPELREALIKMAVEHHLIPIGVKNGLDGNTESAEEIVAEINRRRREKAFDAAPAFLIYRGGSEYDTPAKVERKIREVVLSNLGRVVIDTAHGVECAFDPDGGFKKSVDGQMSALDMVKRLRLEGIQYMGILVEASDNKGQTDPNIPFSMAIAVIREILRSGRPLTDIIKTKEEVI